MPTYQYEAMDNTGLEVKDTIDAGSEQEAQAKIREKGFFVTKITEKGRAKKKTKEATKADGAKKKAAAKKGKTFTMGGVSGKKLTAFT
ncbi:MAG: pilus assembly protein PilC, partial [Planctomycetales bacterium 12-60-4]